MSTPQARDYPSRITYGGFGPAGRRMAAARQLVWTACGLGLVHAGFSLYWALGGSGANVLLGAAVLAGGTGRTSIR